MLQKEVKNLIENRLQDKQVSQNELAKSLDISSATLSKILNGKFDSITESMFLSIKNKLKPTGYQLIQTRNYVEIYDVCTKSREHQLFTAIIGSEGLGKTSTLESYYNQKPNTFMITLDKGMNPKQIFSELAKTIGITPQGSVYEIKRNIISELNKINNPLVIVDEISKTTLVNLTHFQDLWDGIQHNAGLIISGAPHFFEKFKQTAVNRKIGMPELYSRIAYSHYLKKPTKKEIQAICEINGVTDIETLNEVRNIFNFRLLNSFIRNKQIQLI